MAFNKKVWKDRISEYPTRRQLTKENGNVELVTVTRNEGTVSQEGDAFSAANLNGLEERIGNEFEEVNSNLTWKTLKTVTGTTAVSLPSSYMDLSIKITSSDKTKAFKFILIKNELSSTQTNYFEGYDASAVGGQAYSCALKATSTSVSIAAVYIGNEVETSSAIMTVYYR